MDTQEQIREYINAHPEPKRAEIEALHCLALEVLPNGKIWFLDGKDDIGKIVSNPN